MFNDFYELLEINQSAPQEYIKIAYRKQCIKWHPDKNPNVDTTQRMQDINEAYLILKDKEARARYDQEYLKFKSYQNYSEKTYPNYSHEETTSEQDATSHKEKPYKYSDYKVSDEILEKWMANARNQAKKMAEDAIDEFRGATKEAGNSIVQNMLRFILPMLICYLLFKACMYSM